MSVTVDRTRDMSVPQDVSTIGLPPRRVGAATTDEIFSNGFSLFLQKKQFSTAKEYLGFTCINAACVNNYSTPCGTS